MEMPCKCHGMSGSCTTKYCHRSLPSFERVGNYLHKKYRAAVLVTLDQSSNKLVNYDKVIHKYGKPDLVYLEQSPNYCYRNLRQGTVGTAGRECNRSSLSENSCDIICCGHGYNTKKVSLTILTLRRKVVLRLLTQSSCQETSRFEFETTSCHFINYSRKKYCYLFPIVLMPKSINARAII